MIKVFLGIGSNLGKRRNNIKKALGFLKSEGIKINKVSGLYETAPVGGPPRQGKYLNGVIEARTDLKPIALMCALKKIERNLLRKKTVKNGPRTIDLDILFYDGLILKRKNLIIPHPRMHKREFVLRGLKEIAPRMVHPGIKKQVGQLYKEVHKYTRTQVHK
mgnify:FL=1